jgi:TRAP-type C4-dicarboxylate transport system permease small subunit
LDAWLLGRPGPSQQRWEQGKSRRIERRRAVTFEGFDATLQRVEKGMTDLAWVVCIFVTLMIVTDILLRFLFNHPLPASWEISEISMPYIAFFPFAYTSTIDQHIRVSIIKDLMSPRIQRKFEMVANLFCFVVCLMLVYWSWLRFWDSYMIREEILAAIQLPWWVGKFAMPVGMGMFAVRYLMQFIHNCTHPR